VDSLHLRLVGFPGQVELTHPEALRITTGDGELLIAPDVSAQAPELVNVGEYAFLEVMSRREQDPPLRLSLPLRGRRVVDCLFHRLWFVSGIRF